MALLRTVMVGATAVILTAGAAMAGPLHDAAAGGDGALMQQLLRDGADINEQDEAGETALFAAAKAGQYSTHDQLLVAGADASIRDKDGLTPLHAAAGSGNAGPISGLIGEDHHAIRIDINDHDNTFGVTPLSVAAQAGDANLVAYLYGQGADPTIPDKAGLTALTHAGRKGHEKVIAVLLRIDGVCQDIDPAWKADCEKRKAALGLK